MPEYEGAVGHVRSPPFWRPPGRGLRQFPFPWELRRRASSHRQQSKWWTQQSGLNAADAEMMNLKRCPRLVCRFKAELAVVLVVVLAVAYLMHRWGLVCTNYEIKREIDRLCKLYEAGQAMGSLCGPLCSNQVHSISCISKHSKKKIVFTAKWNQRLIVVKSSLTTERLGSPEDAEPAQKVLARRSGLLNGLGEYPSEKEFEKTLRRIAGERLNVTLTRAQLEELRFLQGKDTVLPGSRNVERDNVLTLLQSQEYLLSRLFSDRDVFPQVLGTCGHLYGVEHLQRPMYSSLFALDDKTEWSDRMKLAVAIMDFVEEVETNFPDALYLCDMQINHLGITPSGRVKFLDLDLVYMKNILEKILRTGRPCQQHKDCDFLDCKSTCNPRTNACDAGIANDNLQIICEKIFIGWTMSGKMIIPGLLMSEHTPASLSALLRLCADNAREPVHEDLRQKLYTTLTEMHQILVQKLSPD